MSLYVTVTAIASLYIVAHTFEFVNHYSKDWYKGILDYDEDGEIRTTPRPRPPPSSNGGGSRRKNKRPQHQLE